jgi:CDP-paratose 2-epimerase
LLDFHSPYGCSKGAADQYVRDYSRIYGIDATILRQSCIYGERQFGIEDQGWVAWMMIAALMDKPITIYGDGLQVRDLLYIGDLVLCYDAIYQKRKETFGQIYNIGGGINNTVSIWTEFGSMLQLLCKKKISVKYAANRLGDQLVYISDIRKAKNDFGWKPTTTISNGLKNLYDWIVKNRDLFND